MNNELLNFNRRLCESREPQQIREVLAFGAGKIEAAERAGKKGKFTAKVGHCDKVNQNRRIYSREIWEGQVKKFKGELLANGRLCGAVDHLGYFAGGNLGDTCIIWRDLRIESDGSVFGEYEIVEGHSKGHDLKALRDAGGAIGFSTMGYGTAHEPSEDERKKYGLGESDYCVIMDGNYTLKKIDAVDDPSVADAWDTGEKTEATQESADDRYGVNDFDDLDDEDEEIDGDAVLAAFEALQPAQDEPDEWLGQAIGELHTALAGNAKEVVDHDAVAEQRDQADMARHWDALEDNLESDIAAIQRYGRDYRAAVGKK